MSVEKISKQKELSFGTVWNVYWWDGSWTASSNGIIVARAEWATSGGAGYWYIKDTTDNIVVANISTPTTNGLSATSAFPVKKGHSYTTDNINGVSVAVANFFPFQY